jgi:hypothetical protein
MSGEVFSVLRFASVIDRIALPILTAVRHIIVRRVRLLQIASQVDIEGDRYAHYHEGTDAQYQKPPDHPHSRLG